MENFLLCARHFGKRDMFARTFSNVLSSTTAKLCAISSSSLSLSLLSAHSFSHYDGDAAGKNVD